MFSAEDTYLFAHSAYREVAYQLQLPSSRAAMHRLALEIMEHVHAADLGRVSLELAQHARLGADDLDPAAAAALTSREAAHLARALPRAAAAYQHASVITAARRLAAIASDPATRLDALHRLATALRTTGHLPEAQRALEELEAAADAPPGTRATALIALAEIEIVRGHHAQAEAILDRVHELAARHGDPTVLGRELQYRAHLKESTGDFAGAEALIARALHEFEQVKDSTWLNASLGNLANVYGATGRREQAVATYRQLLGRFRADEQAASVAVAHSNMGRQLMLLGRYAEADEALKVALRIHREHGNRSSLSFALMSSAELALLQGELEQSGRDIDEAIAISREDGYHMRYAACLGVRAGLWLLLGHEDQAQEAAEESRTEFEAAGGAAFVAEYVDVYRLRIAASLAAGARPQGKATSRIAAGPPDPRWIAVARLILKGMQQQLAQRKSQQGTQLQQAVDAGEGLLHELERARDEKRPALVFRGWMPAELTQPQRKALLQRMHRRSRAEFDALRQYQPQLFADLHA